MRGLLSLAVMAVITTPGLAQLQTTCFKGGAEFDCSMFITQFCNSIGTSIIAPNDTMQRCFNNPAVADSQCLFTAANVITTQGIPSVANCGTALTTVAEKCPQGGSGMFSGLTFRFWIDPNDGACGLPSA
ncbi:TMV resistance protein Y3 [Mycena pura]|uniref:TMV resistance protein Y3 n=1 Tax=Mycena pura TaxID=153505 RepID=A0AAD6V0H8_9AGAR|nr:TMV resistance protein Y3 [Mycena pura]